MTKLIQPVIKYIISFLVIWLVLITANLLLAKWKEYQGRSEELTHIQRGLNAEKNDLSQEQGLIERKVSEYESQKEVALQELDRRIDQTVESFEKYRQGLDTVKSNLDNFRKLTEQKGQEVKELKAQLERLSGMWATVKGWFGNTDEVAAATERELAAKEEEQRKLQAYLVQLDEKYDRKEQALDSLAPKDLIAERETIKNQPLDAGLQAKQSRLNSKLEKIDEDLKSNKKQQEFLEGDIVHKFLSIAVKMFPVACWLIVGVFVAPFGIKLFCFYVIAVLVERLKPIRLLPSQGKNSVPVQGESGVSIEHYISPGEELLIRGSYLQSSSKEAPKKTRWFLNHKLPFSSMASGMWILTRIIPPNESTSKVVISSQKNPVSEVTFLDVPEGGSVVIQPRALVGLIKQIDSEYRITRHWRLNQLNAWLTLQLRFLVFHGPCRLILEGTRGVKTEKPNTDAPIMINQSATIGFSPTLEYRNTRCETFMSYFRGQEDLFNDLFDGDEGVFIYEEMPARDRKGGIGGRGIEGLIDTALKIFGV